VHYCFYRVVFSYLVGLRSLRLPVFPQRSLCIRFGCVSDPEAQGAARVSRGSPKEPELFLWDTLGASVSVGTVSANISEICVVDELPIDFLV